MLTRPYTAAQKATSNAKQAQLADFTLDYTKDRGIATHFGVLQSVRQPHDLVHKIFLTFMLPFRTRTHPSKPASGSVPRCRVLRGPLTGGAVSIGSNVDRRHPCPRKDHPL